MMRSIRKSLLVAFFVVSANAGSAHASGSSASIFNTTSSTSSGTDSSGSTSDSSKSEPDDNKPRKLVVPIRVRDEAALYLVGSSGLPQSALLRSTIMAFRRILQDEGKCKQRCTDAEVVYLLLTRTEAVRVP